MRRVLVPILLALACLPATGASAAGPRVVGGVDGDISGWPFLGALVQSGVADVFQAQFCGGSLVAPRLVLTAAHCLDARGMDVVFGRTVLSAPGGERIEVVDVRLPPGFDATRNEPDLALLVLARPASAAPVPIAEAQPAPGTPLEVAGWGVVAQEPRELSADVLQTGTLTALPPRPCARVYGALFGPASMLCASSPVTGVPDSCQGDSGGPLVARDESGAARLVGVVSFGGQRCGDAALPGVYARVDAQRAWLDAEIAGVAADAPPAAAPEPVANPRSIRLRFGRMACPSSRCYVDIRTTGPVEQLAGGLVLWVRRGGRRPIDRFALARRVSRGHWRAWVNLPLGRLRLVAVGVDAEANPVTLPVRDTIRVTPA